MPTKSFPRRAPRNTVATRGSFSPLVLADRLITLAQEADRAGYPESASRLIRLVDTVLDDDGTQAAA